MKTKIYIMSLLLCLASSAVSAQSLAPKGEDPKPAEKKWYETVNFSGYVDVYYKYTSNNRQGATQDTSGTFDTYNKQFAVNAVKLSMEKLADKESPWGMRLDMQNGSNIMYQERPYQTTNSIYNMQLLQQAYVSFYFPVLKGLVVDAGKMATHIGNEVLDSKDNVNYTIGYIFFNTIPFIHTGARGTLTITDRLSAGLYIYNSGQGTGYTANGEQFGYSGTTPVNQNQLFSTSNHVYVDGPNPMRAFGSQVRYEIIPDKVKVVWNTLYSNDNNRARQSDAEYYLAQDAAAPFRASGINAKNSYSQSRFALDNWFINHISLIFNPTDRWMVLLDWTFGQRRGQTMTASAGYPNEGFLVDTNRDGTLNAATDFKVGRDRRDAVKIYNTYGIWSKYKFTDRFALGFRFEYIDDSRYGGSLTVNQPTAFTTPRDRLDLLAASGDISTDKFKGLGRPSSSLGQIKTLTLTPTFDWTENLQVKVDLRRDWGPGRQFIDQAGNLVAYQHGIIIGVVAKF